MTYTSGPWEWLYAETHHDGIGRVVTAQVVDVATSQCVVEFSNTSHSEITYEDDGDGAGSFFDVQARANARLISAAPCMYEAGLALNGIVEHAQDILTEYLKPDGMSKDEAINQLLSLLDGPDQRAAQNAMRAALLKAKGET